ncbi:hypothetical protein HAX54_039824 [Datura stramonium]|uniref:Leucine-rich repeat-containing N-terminal plant-type domain-containing protein n=1 Tax=Datura stramonium TaxID=4076 RepID=A0ABS8VLU3_DATST|nr:hypothetical protein [Datura stramonium]
MKSLPQKLIYKLNPEILTQKSSTKEEKDAKSKRLIISGTQLALGQDRDGIIITKANYQALEALRQELVDPKGYLRSWNDSGYGACSGTWVGINCARGQVIAIQLPLKGLKRQNN